VSADRRQALDQRDFFARNEAIRHRRLREDARHAGGELLEAAMRLSRFAAELRAATWKPSTHQPDGGRS
jgi:hypothetical protein